MKRKYLNCLGASVLAFAILGSSSAVAQQAVSMDELLRQVEQGRINDNQENRQREERFRASSWRN